MKRENHVKKKIEAGETVIGLYCAIPSPEIVEIAGICGMDYIRIDCHHAHSNLETVANMIRAAEVYGVTPFVRVFNDAQRILSVLDMGAMGVLIPDISNAEEAKAAVEATKYAPVGDRGLFSNSRASDYGDFSGAKYLEWAAENIMLGVQIENKSAVENIEKILAVEGIDFILSGRNDLSQSFGVGGDKNHPLVVEAENRITKAAADAGIMLSLNINPHTSNMTEQYKKLVSDGCKMVTLSTDISFLLKSLKDTVSKLKA